MAPIPRKKSFRRRWRRALLCALLILVALGDALYALRGDKLDLAAFLPTFVRSFAGPY